MSYLEQFARNKKSKEETEVLTARLPKTLYGNFKNYCDDLGLSISEGVCLLVEKEMDVFPDEPESTEKQPRYSKPRVITPGPQLIAECLRVEEYMRDVGRVVTPNEIVLQFEWSSSKANNRITQAIRKGMNIEKVKDETGKAKEGQYIYKNKKQEQKS
ncbi:TPA: hypothetical protein REU56_002933 [Listeria monocytogenes]|nr:hypothetical protein [Listeria monocytogenes]